MIIRPKSPLGLKYLQIVPGDPRRARGGRNDPARRGPAGTGRHRPVLRHVRRGDADQHPAQPGRLRQRLRRPRPAAERSVRRAARLARKQPAGAARARRPQHQLRRLLAGARGALGDRRPGGRDAGRPLRRPRPHLRRLRPGLAAVHPGNDLKGPADPRRRQRRPAGAAALPRDSARFFTALQPGAKALAETSPTIDAALRAGIPALNRSPALFAQLEPTAEALLAFQEAPGRLQRPRPPDRHQRTAGAGDPVPRPGADRLQLPDARLPQPGRRVQRNQRRRQLAGRDRLRGAGRAERRGRPASAPANGPEDENHLHFNPYPNTAAPGQTGECEAGNERYEAGETRIGNVAQATRARDDDQEGEG